MNSGNVSINGPNIPNIDQEASVKKQRKNRLNYDPAPSWEQPLLPPPPQVNREDVESALNFRMNPHVIVDLKTLAMVIGDSFINNSTLEGGSSRNALKYLNNFKSFFPEAVNNRLEELREFYSFDNQTSNYDKSLRLELMSKWLANKMVQSNRCTFIGGYCESNQGNSGHNVIFEIFCEGNDNFGTIRVFQQGDGIEYHSQQDLNYTRRHGAYYEKKEIPREILTNPILFVALLGPKLIKKPHHYHWTGSIIYDFIAAILPGVEVTSDTYIKQMKGGLCYYKCFLSLFKTYMDEQSYNRFVLSLKVTTLLAFDDNYRADQYQNAQVVARFIAELSEKMQRSLKDHRQIQTYSKKTLDVIDDYLKGALQRYRTFYYHPIHQLPSQLKMKNTPVPTKTLIDSLKIGSASYNEINLSDGCSAELPPQLIFKQVQSPDEICQHFDEILEYLQKTMQKNLYLNALYTAALAISQLPPIFTKDSPYLEKCTREQSLHILSQIHSLMNDLSILGLKFDFESNREYELILKTVLDWLYVSAVEMGASLFTTENKENYLRFNVDRTIPTAHEEYETPFVTTDDDSNEFTPHAAGAIRKLLEDLLSRPIIKEDKNNTGLFTEVMDGAIDVHDDDLKLYEFLLQAAIQDDLNLILLDEEWAYGKYLQRLFVIRKNEPELNAIAQLVQIQIMYTSGLPWNNYFEKEEIIQVGNDKGYYITLKHQERTNECPSLYDISPFNIAYNDTAHPVIAGLCPEINGFLTPFEWLQRIEEEPNILIDACPAIIRSLTTYCVDNGTTQLTGIHEIYASCGLTPLSMTLRSESGKIWVERLNEALLDATEIADERFGSRAAAALLIAAVVNLEIWRDQQQQNLCLDIETIQFPKITHYDYPDIELKSQWPVEALHILCLPNLDPFLLKVALSKVTTEIGNGDLYEALHRRVFAETGTSFKDFLGSFEVGSGLPITAKSVRGYTLIQNLGIHKSFRQDSEIPNRWIATNGECRVTLRPSESYWELRGDYLKVHLRNTNKKIDTQIIDDNIYYTYLTGANLEAIDKIYPLKDISSDLEKWLRSDCKQVLVINKIENDVFVWEGDYIYNSVTQLYLAKFSKTKKVLTKDGEIELLDILAPEFQQLWTDNNGTVKLIAIPKYNLHFKVIWSQDKRAKLISVENPGFKVYHEAKWTEAEGLLSTCLIDDKGNERMIAIHTSTQNNTKNLLWADWKTGEKYFFKIYVLDRAASNNIKTNKELRSLFSGDINGLTLIVRGLLRTRHYDLAKKYVDLIIRLETQTEFFNELNMDDIKLIHPKAIVLILRLKLYFDCSLESLSRKYLEVYHLLPEGWLLSPHEEAKLSSLNPTRVDKVKELVIKEGESEQKRSRLDENDTEKKPTGIFENHRRRIAEEASINKTYSSLTKWHIPVKGLKIDVDFDLTKTTTSADEFKFEDIFTLKKLSLLHIMTSMSLNANSQKPNLTWALLDGLYLIISRLHPSGNKNIALHDTLIHRLRMQLTSGNPKIFPSLPEVISQQFNEEVETLQKGNMSFVEFAMKHHRLREQLIYSLKNSQQEANQFLCEFKSESFNNEVLAVPYAEYNPSSREFQRHRVQRTKLGQRTYTTPEGIVAAINQRLNSEQDIEIVTVGGNPQFTSEFLECSKKFFEKNCEWRNVNDWTSNGNDIFEILNQLSQSTTLPIAHKKVVELQNHLKSTTSRLELHWKEGVHSQVIEWDLDDSADNASKQIEIYRKKIIELLNPNIETDMEKFTELHGFIWMSRLEKAPKTGKLLELATCLKELSANSIWLSTCLRANKLLKQKKLQEILGILSNCFECQGLPGALPWRLAAFSWLHEVSLRKDQAEILPELIHKQNSCLVKKQTGFGKSQLLTPFAFHHFEKNLLINVVPPGLLDGQVKLVQSICHTGVLRFAQYIHSKNQITLITNPTEESERICMVTSDQDLLKLVISYFKSLLEMVEAGNVTSDAAKTFEAVKKIEKDVKRLFEESQGLFDEPQTLFDGTRETALGRKCVTGIPKDRGAVASVIFQILVQMKVFKPGSKEPIPNFIQYREQLSKHLVNHPLFGLKNDQKQFVFTYLTSPANLEQEVAAQFEKQLLKLGEKQARLVSIARAQLQLYLPYTLTERFKVSYGPKNGSKEARPYRAADTPASGNSTHAVLETMINFTMQMYLINGLNNNEVDDLIHAWREEGPESAETTLKRALVGTAYANASFRELTTLQKDALKEIKNALQKSPVAALEYVTLCVLPYLKFSTTKIRVTGATLSTLIPRAVTWSATPVNRFGYPLSLREGIFDLSVDLDTMYKLVDPKCTELYHVDTFDPINFAKYPGQYAVVDPQANLFQYNNLQIAKRILEGARPEIERVAFYNTDPSDEGWKTMDRNHQIFPLRATGEPDNSLFYLLDQDRAEGTDLPLPDCTVSVPVSAGITYYRLHQACGRARRWGKGQKIHLLIDKSLNVRNIHALIKDAFNNEGKELQGCVITMHKDLMTEVCRGRLLPKLFQCKSHLEIVTLVSQTKDLIETVIDIDAFYQVGLTPPPDDRTIINEHYNQLMQKYGESFLDESDRQTLFTLLQGCLSLIPEQSSNAVTFSQLSMTAEAEQEMSVLKDHHNDDEGELRGIKLVPEKVFNDPKWKEKFLIESDEELNKEPMMFDGKLSIAGLQPLTNGLFPSNLFMSKAFMRYTWSDTELHRDPSVWMQFPQAKTIMRVITKAGLLRFILINDREAHQIAHYMRVTKDYKEHEEKCGFRATLLSITGAQIMSAANAPIEYRSVEKATHLMLCILRGFNGTSPYEKDREVLKQWVYQEKERAEDFYQFLMVRLQDKNLDHPDHPSRSPLVKMLHK